MFRLILVAAAFAGVALGAANADTLVLTRPDGCANDRRNYDFLASRCSADPGSRAWTASDVIRRTLAPGDMSRQEVMRCGDLSQWANLCRYPQSNNSQAGQINKPQRQSAAPTSSSSATDGPRIECVSWGCFDARYGNPKEQQEGTERWARAWCSYRLRNGPLMTLDEPKCVDWYLKKARFQYTPRPEPTVPAIDPSMEVQPYEKGKFAPLALKTRSERQGRIVDNCAGKVTFDGPSKKDGGNRCPTLPGADDWTGKLVSSCKAKSKVIYRVSYEAHDGGQFFSYLFPATLEPSGTKELRYLSVCTRRPAVDIVDVTEAR